MAGNNENNENNESNESNESNEIKRVKLHFIYVSIILSLLILILVSCIFYGIEVSWQFLSFAGVALSLVLSVIAILITLIDVAGQKQQVYEIFKSSEELKESINHQQETIKKHAENISNVDELLNSAFEKHLNGLSIVDSDYSINKPNEIVSDTKNEDELLSTAIVKNSASDSLFTRVYKTFYINKSLNGEQEKRIDNIMWGFKTVKIKIYEKKVVLVSNELYTSPFIDKSYEKQRASILLERYLKEEGILSST